MRFLFIAMHRSDFRDEVLAELLPPLEPDGTSHLWEAVGRHFTGLSYREADQLSKKNKEFIKASSPSEIYATLLSARGAGVIGEVGEQTRGVEKLLRRIGFRYAAARRPLRRRSALHRADRRDLAGAPARARRPVELAPALRRRALQR